MMSGSDATPKPGLSGIAMHLPFFTTWRVRVKARVDMAGSRVRARTGFVSRDRERWGCRQ